MSRPDPNRNRLTRAARMAIKEQRAAEFAAHMKAEEAREAAGLPPLAAVEPEPAPEPEPEESKAKAPKKIRLDQLLTDRGLAPSRSRAQAIIIAGTVFLGEQRLDKPGLPMAPDAEVTVRGGDHPWVSRGGIKLASGLDRFAIDPAGLVAVDVGTSTGGFTDVLLTRGATRVYAVDVGHGQLDWKLRNDPRVVVMERTNARHLTAAEITEPLDIVVCDASFIGLETVLPASLALAKPGARLVALIKPQFEVGKGQVGKGGVVRDPALHQAVCDRITAWLGSVGWNVLGVDESPITGPEGNREFLVGAVKAAA